MRTDLSSSSKIQRLEARRPRERLLVSIIIPNYNRAAYTGACLQSLLRTSYEPLEFVVIDNGSSDPTPRVLKSFRSACRWLNVRCQVIRNDDNLGPVIARNQGIAAARGEYLVFMDNDVAVKERDWLARLSQKFAGDPQLGIIAPRLIFPWKPFLIQSAGVGVSRTGLIGFIGRGRKRTDARHGAECEVQSANASCMMLRGSVVDEIGMLDEAFAPIRGDDLDFCYRARTSGYKTIYAPAVELFHFEGITARSLREPRLKRLALKGIFLFKQRWHNVYAKEHGPPGADLESPVLEKKELSQVDWMEAAKLK